MACDCIAKINEQLAPDHYLNTTFALRSGDVEKPIIGLTRRDTWKPETRRGKPGFFLGSHCPFCGVAYEPASQAPPLATVEQP